MKKPVIGILGNRMEADGNSCSRHVVNDTYVNAVVRAGGLPIMIPICDLEEDQDTYIEMCDGILAPGGGDFNPLLFHEDPHPLLGETSTRLDVFQLAMIRKATAKKLPMLGICRGAQAMNLAAGGTIYQDMSQKEGKLLMHQMTEQDTGEAIHMVKFEEGTRLYEMFGSEVPVNSFHHEAVREPGEGYRVAGRANDGIIEAIEGTGDVFAVGLQWHPEVMLKRSDRMMPIFQAFVKAAGEK